MKPLRTIVTPEKPAFSISHQDKLISIGSCFSENIGKKFRDYKFNININPFGQQYNPFSVAQAIQRLISAVPYTSNDLVYHDELYHSYDHHGSFSGSNPEETLQFINENLLQAAGHLKEASVLFLTFGTSHVFSLKETHLPGHGGQGGRIVSNCHKLSGNVFTRRLMKPAEIVDTLDKAIIALRKINAGIKIILTISPVRYFAFGHYENSVSKSHLFTALYELQQRYSELYYFPAYELVMDDLRDYRFFAEDMLHPNYQATEYVWESLCNTMFDKKTLELFKDIDEILLAAKHRPRNPKSEAHKKFVMKNLERIEELGKSNRISFTQEEEYLRKYL